MTHLEMTTIDCVIYDPSKEQKSAPVELLEKIAAELGMDVSGDLLGRIRQLKQFNA